MNNDTPAACPQAQIAEFCTLVRQGSDNPAALLHHGLIIANWLAERTVARSDFAFPTGEPAQRDSGREDYRQFGATLVPSDGIAVLEALARLERLRAVDPAATIAWPVKGIGKIAVLGWLLSFLHQQVTPDLGKRAAQVQQREQLYQQFLARHGASGQPL